MNAFRVLTLNTWNVKGPWEKRWEIIFSGIEKIKPDFVAFQEIFDADWALEIVKRAGFPQYVLSEPEFGLMMLSRRPIENWSSVHFKTMSKAEPGPRAMLMARLEVGEQILGVINTHLSWRLDEGYVREGQVEELMDMAHREFHGHSHIAAGDFNAPPDSPEIRRMIEEAKFRDSYGDYHPGQPGYTWNNENPYTASHDMPDRRLDYIFFRDDANLLKRIDEVEIVFTEPNKNGVFASDHYGLVTDFALGSGGSGKLNDG